MVLSTLQMAQEQVVAAEAPTNVTAGTFFADSPWLKVPLERQALISIEPRYPRGGLLGGSSKEAPKTSKLAALAAARKKKALETSSSEDKPPSTSVALLDKLGKTKNQETRSSEVPSEQAGTGSRPTTSFLRQRKHPSKQGVQLREEPRVEKGPSAPIIPPELPAEESVGAIANPSSFAATMLGSHRIDTLSSLSTTSYNPFQLNCDLNEANFNPFAGPSPDDIVAKAQSASKGMKSKSQQKTSGMRHGEVDKVTNGLSKSTISDSPRPSPRSKNLNVVAEYEKSKKKHTVNFVVIGGYTDMFTAFS